MLMFPTDVRRCVEKGGAALAMLRPRWRRYVDRVNGRTDIFPRQCRQQVRAPTPRPRNKAGEILLVEVRLLEETQKRTNIRIGQDGNGRISIGFRFLEGPDASLCVDQ
jgi:hypothetical protein